MNYPYSSVCSWATEKCLHSAFRTNQRDMILNLPNRTVNSVSSNVITTTRPAVKDTWRQYRKTSCTAHSILVHSLQDKVAVRGVSVALWTPSGRPRYFSGDTVKTTTRLKFTNGKFPLHDIVNSITRPSGVCRLRSSFSTCTHRTVTYREY